MTRQHNLQIHCPNCGVMITHETSFGRWIRNNKQLDSSNGYCVIDQDYWIHRFKTFRDRDFQLIMLVEIKTHGSDLTNAQRDTLLFVNEIMRNDRNTPTKKLPWYFGGSSIRKVKSIIAGKEVILRTYGMHTLRFSGLGPDDSDTIFWDKKLINLDVLTSILRFDLDPFVLRPIDLRNHHPDPNEHQWTMFDFLTSSRRNPPPEAVLGE